MNSSTPFTFVPTEDGSLSLRIGNDPENFSEAMHSLKGAFSETVYIYGTAIDTMLERGFRPRVLSLGLGMGYVEVLATALMLRAGIGNDSNSADCGGESYEILPELRDRFVHWATAGAQGEAPPDDFTSAYDALLERTAQQTGVDSNLIRSTLGRWILEGRWIISEAMSSENLPRSSFGAICFDAFSSKTSPDLWTEDFLDSFLTRAADEKGCVLSTYACTGALKRTLRKHGFELNIREGFASKRDSTIAIKN